MIVIKFIVTLWIFTSVCFALTFSGTGLILQSLSSSSIHTMLYFSDSGVMNLFFFATNYFNLSWIILSVSLFFGLLYAALAHFTGENFISLTAWVCALVFLIGAVLLLLVPISLVISTAIVGGGLIIVIIGLILASPLIAFYYFIIKHKKESSVLVLNPPLSKNQEPNKIEKKDEMQQD